MKACILEACCFEATLKTDFSSVFISLSNLLVVMVVRTTFSFAVIRQVGWLHQASWMVASKYPVPSLKLTATAPENGWLEDDFPFGKPYFQVRTVSFREGITYNYLH